MEGDALIWFYKNTVRFHRFLIRKINFIKKKPSHFMRISNERDVTNLKKGLIQGNFLVSYNPVDGLTNENILSF